MIVARWGDSLAVRIPADVVEALNLKEGDSVDLRLRDRDGAAHDIADKRQAAIASLREFRGTAPKNFRFDREEANAR